MCSVAGTGRPAVGSAAPAFDHNQLIRSAWAAASPQVSRSNSHRLHRPLSSGAIRAVCGRRRGRPEARAPGEGPGQPRPPPTLQPRSLPPVWKPLLLPLSHSCRRHKSLITVMGDPRMSHTSSEQRLPRPRGQGALEAPRSVGSQLPGRELEADSALLPVLCGPGGSGQLPSPGPRSRGRCLARLPGASAWAGLGTPGPRDSSPQPCLPSGPCAHSLRPA